MNNNKIILPNKLSFKDVVKGLSDHDVIPIDNSINADLKIEKADYIVIQDLYHIMYRLVKNGTRVHANGKMRINDINNQVVDMIMGELSSLNSVEFKKLLSNSYGDIELNFHYKLDTGIELIDKINTYYIEIICTTRNESDESNDYLRSLYLSSSLKNITKDGKHILIRLTFDYNQDTNIYTLKNPTLYDLSKLNLNMKIEYNASMKDIINSGEL